ncbi:hypothetical protein D1AOALGA4SA_248 [Olavius algarvensis Delta 1 endosymbiont]|nr:hypothetical protein D1AOALGA4SA_248 [Olavius algarvensis Delta 1 endosymbiont]
MDAIFKNRIFILALSSIEYQVSSISLMWHEIQFQSNY